MSEAALKAVPAQHARGPRYVFKIPASARMLEADPQEVTLVPLTLEQDMHGNKLVDQSKSIYDKIKLSIVAVNGSPISWGAALDSAVDSMSPKCRDLIARAYMQLHAPSDDEASDFLASMRAEV